MGFVECEFSKVGFFYKLTVNITTEFRIGSTLMNQNVGFIASNKSVSNLAMPLSGTMILPIATDRILSLRNSSSGTASITFLRVGCYRRLGTNI